MSPRRARGAGLLALAGAALWLLASCGGLVDDFQVDTRAELSVQEGKP